MPCIAIDPGPDKSALLVWTGSRIEVTCYLPNEDILGNLGESRCLPSPCPLVIEQVACYGMPVGQDVFETVRWSGRFEQEYGSEWTHYITRIQIKTHLCHSSRAKDSNIRQALVDRFGGKERAIGRRASPGPLYDVSGHLWSALALAITWHDLNAVAEEAIA